MARSATRKSRMKQSGYAGFLPAAVFLLLVLIVTSGVSAKDLPLQSLRLPRGFQISVYADNVAHARSMALGSKGTLFVGTRKAGVVYAVRDNDGDNRADQVLKIATGLNSPNGVAFSNGSLYVAEISRILRYDNIEDHLKNPPSPVVVNDTFPTDRAHGWKFIRFGPDGKLYIPVGAPCNVCLQKNPVYASITRMNPDGTELEIFAHGVRNTVGFDWNPRTNKLWFTDNGRDWMGDNVPPDELNRAPEKGVHFGFPFCHGEIPDPVFGAMRSCKEFVPPALAMPAHVAALGMRFYTGKMFPPE
jgi:glucose/arabinose dehydrogenase